MLHDDKFNIENVENEQKIQLAFNIWPLGRGVLHYLALGGEGESKDQSEQNDQIQAYNSAQELFNTTS